MSDAEEIARKAFLQYSDGHVFPEDCIQRMSRSVGRDGGDWVVEVRLFPAGAIEAADGLRGDIEGPRSELLAEIRVDAASGEVRVCADRRAWPSARRQGGAAS